MKIERILPGILVVMFIFLCGCQDPLQDSLSANIWEVHDMNRPRPEVVKPGDNPGEPPSDAIVLFDGSDLSQWLSEKGGPAAWKIKDGFMEVVPKLGGIRTRQDFGSCQLHIEWASPAEVKGDSQGRGNSGIYLMGRYEVQVLDSYQNDTYPDGQAGAIYGQKPPLVNACRAPGQWQTYDIIFHRPVFDGEKLLTPATITVLQNGVLIQDHWVIQGTTMHKERARYQPHADKLPFSLQDHGNPVRYRNIWIRELD
ncbi:MAG: DUF1080 domain-containing protein [Sedimentisphaerales bacterium]|nr:DUF1080 domain-containing protein [Sedimentisphaerales bacterium]